jgi:hypothetical protein
MQPSTPPPPIRYRRLPGTGSHLFTRVRLYVGPDHLLQVIATGYSERYRRFFFGDIQVLSLHRTVQGTIWDVVWAALLVAFGALALVNGVDGWPWGVAFGLVATFLARSLFAGPTCACYVQTAVQQQRLYSLGRMRRARKVFGQLRPMILAAQGQPEAGMGDSPTLSGQTSIP